MMSFGFLEFGILAFLLGSCVLGIIVGKSIKYASGDFAEDAQESEREFPGTRLQGSDSCDKSSVSALPPSQDYYLRQAKSYLRLADLMKNPVSARVLRSAAADNFARAGLTADVDSSQGNNDQELGSPLLGLSDRET
jgi:hypothetical protein